MPSAGLVRPKGYNWKDSNLALFGSPAERKIKKASAETEKAWAEILKINEDKLFVWRIHAFELEPVPPQDHGVFFGGDSYIVLKISKIAGGTLSYHAHFWIGSESSADEYGTAAYKTVELDNFLDDKAIQHREVQDFESDLFLSYFKRLQVLDGGYKSGFKHVNVNEYKPRLLWFHVSGRGIPQATEVRFSRKSLNSDDVFILDLGTSAIQWNGNGSNGREKIAAAAFLQELEGERAGKCATKAIEESDAEEHANFIKLLPDEPIPEAAPITKKKEVAKALFKISDADGSMKFTLLTKGSAPKGMITEDDVFIIDGSTGLFVYIGAKCSPAEKNNSLSHAHAYLMGTDHPFAPITVVGSGQRDEDFNALLE